MKNHFEGEVLAILSEKVSEGKLSRRSFTQIAAFLVAGAPLALQAKGARAAANELVLVNWGGDAIKAYDAAYAGDFTKASGIAVKQDGSGPTEGAIEAQFKSGKPSWDVVDVDPFSAEALGAKGMMEPIDYSIVDPNKMRKGFGWKYSASSYFYSYVIAYDSAKYGDKAPTGMADFFDVEKFPGKRAMYKWGTAMWEAALLADGVAPDKLYPLDLERAHKKIAARKDDVVSYWGGGADSQSVLLNGEASMAIIWSTRASLVEQDSGGQIKFIWDQGLIAPGAFGIVKGGPAGKDAAMQFIASTQDPEKQLKIFESLGQGPANPAADSLIPAERQRFNPVDPKNMSKQIALDMGWYETNYGPALDEYTKIISA